MDTVIYEDKTHRDIWLKLVLGIPVAFLLVPALCSLAKGDNDTAVAMLGTVLLMVAIFWIIIPRTYLILDGKVKIVFAGPFSFTIPFDTIKEARIPKATSFGMNLPSSLSGNHAVEIVRKKRLNVLITPDNRDLFLESLKKAMDDWAKYHSGSMK
jgi:hypothetical protein